MVSLYSRKIDSDATLLAQNCIIFVHCAIFCLEFISVCMYVCMRVSRMFILHESSVCMLLCIVIHVFVLSHRGMKKVFGLDRLTPTHIVLQHAHLYPIE